MKWTISVYKDQEQKINQEFASFKEAMKFARRDVLGEKNDNMNLPFLAQTNESFEIDFLQLDGNKVAHLYNSKDLLILLSSEKREDEYHLKRALADNITASEIGKLGGASTSKAKKLSSKKNGKLGGRPKKPKA